MSSKKRHNYKNLKIWKLGLEIANDVSDLLVNFPKHEVYDLSSQLSKCSVSMPSNIAEGTARTDKSFSHFLDVSLGSAFEWETQLIVAYTEGYIKEDHFREMETKVQKLQKMISGFLDGLDNKTTS